MSINASALLARLKLRAVIQPSEGFSDPDLTALIVDSVRQHNAGYVLPNGTDVAVPAEQLNVCLLFSWAELLLVRASRLAMQPSVSGGPSTPYGSDRDTPYYKCMDLRKKLMEQYNQQCAVAGISSSAQMTPQVTELTVESPYDASLPSAQSQAPPTPLLVSDSLSGGEWKLSWSVNAFDNFACFMLVVESASSSSLLAPWNIDSASGFNGLREDVASSDKVAMATILDPLVRNFRVVNVGNTGPYRAVLLHVSRSGRFTFSNELLVS